MPEKSPELLQTPTLYGCATLANNLTEFVSRDALPISINLSQLDDGSGLLSTVIKNEYKMSQDMQKPLWQSETKKFVPWTHCKHWWEFCFDEPFTQGHVHQALLTSKLFVCLVEVYLFPVRNDYVPARKTLVQEYISRLLKCRETALVSKISYIINRLYSAGSLVSQWVLHSFPKHRNRHRGMNSSGQDPHRLKYGSVVSELVQFMEESYV